jgi:hypothetical protein
MMASEPAKERTDMKIGICIKQVLRATRG